MRELMFQVCMCGRSAYFMDKSSEIEIDWRRCYNEKTDIT